MRWASAVTTAACWSAAWPEDVEAWLHVRAIDEPGEVGEREDELVVAASTFKAAVALAFFDLIEAGLLDPRAPVLLAPGARSDGPTGISVLRDEVELSLRDAAALMLSVSDNAATDALLARIGVGRVHERLRELGLVDTFLGDRLATGFPADVRIRGEERQLAAGRAERGRRRRLSRRAPVRARSLYDDA